MHRQMHAIIYCTIRVKVDTCKEMWGIWPALSNLTNFNVFPLKSTLNPPLWVQVSWIRIRLFCCCLFVVVVLNNTFWEFEIKTKIGLPDLIPESYLFLWTTYLSKNQDFIQSIIRNLASYFLVHFLAGIEDHKGKQKKLTKVWRQKRLHVISSFLWPMEFESSDYYFLRNYMQINHFALL